MARVKKTSKKITKKVVKRATRVSIEETIETVDGQKFAKSDKGYVEIDGDYYAKDSKDIVQIDGGFYLKDDSDVVEVEGEWFLIHSDDIVDIDGDYYKKTSNLVCWDSYSEEYNLKSKCLVGWVDYQKQGYFSKGDSDYVFIDSTAEYYLNSDVADDHGWYYCDECGEYVHRDEHSSHENGEFDNRVKGAVKSPSHTICGGMRYTFGVEIETDEGEVDEDDQAKHNWASVSDGSIGGHEYVTGILKGDTGFKELRAISDTLNRTGHKVKSNCGLHVHVGGAYFTKRFSVLAIMLGTQLEDELFAMMPGSRRKNSYCRGFKDAFKRTTIKNGDTKLAQFVFGDVYGDEHQQQRIHEHERRIKFSRRRNRKHARDKYCDNRYTWLNLVLCNKNGSEDIMTRMNKQTIEFRLHSGTIDYEKMKNWVLICMSFVNFVENHQDSIIKKKVKLKHILKASLGKRADEVLAYVKNRTDKFKADEATDGSED